MLIKVYRTTRYKIKESALEQACLALCLASKNLKNTGMFLIRNVLSSLDTQTNTLKTILNENHTRRNGVLAAGVLRTSYKKSLIFLIFLSDW